MLHGTNPYSNVKNARACYNFFKDIGTFLNDNPKMEIEFDVSDLTISQNTLHSRLRGAMQFMQEAILGLNIVKPVDVLLFSNQYKIFIAQLKRTTVFKLDNRKLYLCYRSFIRDGLGPNIQTGLVKVLQDVPDFRFENYYGVIEYSPGDIPTVPVYNITKPRQISPIDKYNRDRQKQAEANRLQNADRLLQEQEKEEANEQEIQKLVDWIAEVEEGKQPAKLTLTSLDEADDALLTKVGALTSDGKISFSSEVDGSISFTIL